MYVHLICHGSELLNSGVWITIIDNSFSMKLNIERVIEVVVLLSYLIKLSAPDKIDMYFTRIRTLVEARGSTPLVLAVKKEELVGVSNIEASLSNILEPYREKLDLQNRQSKLSLRAKTSLKVQPLSVYVLTDAK